MILRGDASPAANRPGATMTSEATRSRPLRRDAIRNHQLVLEAARDVLAEFGTDASMELIASRAGVGIGTVYRRFPNKEALVDEIAGQMLALLTEEARRALTLADGTGLESFLRVAGQSLSDHRGYADKLVGRTKTACVEKLRDLVAELLVQAQRAGRAAPGVELGDVMAVFWSLRGIVETSGSVAPGAWQRHLDILLAGLRAAGTTPSPHPAVTRDQLRRITTDQADGAQGPGQAQTHEEGPASCA